MERAPFDPIRISLASPKLVFLCGSNGQGGNHIDADIAALLQALQQGNSTAVNNAVTALGNDVHPAAGALDVTIPHFIVQVEYMWA